MGYLTQQGPAAKGQGSKASPRFKSAFPSPPPDVLVTIKEMKPNYSSMCKHAITDECVWTFSHYNINKCVHVYAYVINTYTHLHLAHIKLDEETFALQIFKI